MLSAVLKRRAKGFTLIELLVVIAIVAILAAILFPVFVNARNTAQRGKCQSNLKQIVIAAMMYADDNGGFTPPPIYAFVQWGQVNEKGWTELINRYVRGPSGIKPRKGAPRVYVCPSAGYDYSYGICWAHAKDPRYRPGEYEPANKGFYLGSVVRPSKMIWFFDLRPRYSDDDRWAIDCGTRDSGISNDNQEDGEVYYKHPTKGTMAIPIFYLAWPGVHNEGNNLAFADGHVGWYSDWKTGQMTFYPEKSL